MANPQLLAGESSVQETKAGGRMTAFLKPNPDVTFTLDQLQFVCRFAPCNNCCRRSVSATCTSAPTSANCASPARSKATPIAEPAAGRPGAHPAVHPARRLCAGAAGQGGAGRRQRESGLLRQAVRHQPRPLAAGDIAAVDLERVRTAASAVRSGLTNAQINLRTAKITLHDDAQRPHGGRPVRRGRAVRFHRQPAAAGASSTRRRWKRGPILKAAKSAVQKGADGSQTGGGQRLDRSHVRRGFRTATLLPRLRGRERLHPAADLRPQPGRKGAHADRYHARRAAAGRDARRCSATWIRRIHAVSTLELLRSYKETTVIWTALRIRARPLHFLTSMAGGAAAIFWTRSAIIARCRWQLHQSHRVLFHCGRSAQYGGRPRGHPMKRKLIIVGAVCSGWPGAGRVAKGEPADRKPKLRRRRRWSRNRMPAW